MEREEMVLLRGLCDILEYLKVVFNVLQDKYKVSQILVFCC